nr:MAG TPA: hypothetical protein [Caudoviricetes sp.]
MINDKTIEQKAGDAILQVPQNILVGTKTYKVASPSVATLIKVSQCISTLPNITLDKAEVVKESLSIAKYCEPFGEALAILILGAKNLTEKRTIQKEIEVEEEKIVYKSYLFGLFKRPLKTIQTTTKVVAETIEVDKKAELAKELLENFSPSELYNITATLIGNLQLGDFFGISIFLTEINLLRPTKMD